MRTQPRSDRTQRPNSAFTLIEMVISASLMSLVLASSYLCLSSGIASRKVIEARAEVVQSARVALAMLGADLRAACPLSKETPFLGMPRKLEDIEADNIDFATHHYTPRRAHEGDYCQMSYFLAKEPESGQFSLWRRRHPGIGLDPLAGGSREEIARGLRGLKFEYYDGFDWYDEWGDSEGRSKAQNSLKPRPNLEGMPEAVRVTLWFQVGTTAPKRARSDKETESEVLTFQTVCRLNLADLALPRSSEVSTGNSSASGQPAGPGGKQ